MVIKPCRCRTFSCDQKIDLSVRLLEIDPAGSPLDEYKSIYLPSDQRYLDVTATCVYRVNVMPNLQV